MHAVRVTLYQPQANPPMIYQVRVDLMYSTTLQTQESNSDDFFY